MTKGHNNSREVTQNSHKEMKHNNKDTQKTKRKQNNHKEMKRNNNKDTQNMQMTTKIQKQQ